MITIEESQNLIEKFIELRILADETKTIENIRSFKNHERLCIEQFMYLVTMKTNYYRSFSNYEDLNQEGLIALVKSMKTYNPKKGLFFYWSHKYIGTRISRHASLHTVIRYPLKVAKALPPHKESALPLLIEELYCPDKMVEASEIRQVIDMALNSVSEEGKIAITLAFGFNGDKPLSFNKLCKAMNLSRSACFTLLDNTFSILKDTIKL